MANLFFILFHLIAIIFGFWMLLISIPLHIFYSMNKSNTNKLSKDIKEQTEVLKNHQEDQKENNNNESSDNSSSVADELNKLSKLKESGVLTEDEFNLQKEKLLK
jgi:uncharacterized membrane protein